MAGSFSNQFVKHLGKNVLSVDGYFALGGADGYEVVAVKPTTVPGALPGSGPYTYAPGLTDAIGTTIKTQPYTSTGVYTFTIDGGIPAGACLFAAVTLVDQGATEQLFITVDVNCLTVSDTNRNNLRPGTNSNLTNKTVVVKFRTHTGTLTNPKYGFFIHLVFQQTDVN